MDERELREIDGDHRVRPESTERAPEPPDELARRREQQQRALTARERGERWPCG
jgi:hypothetical protein